MKKLLLLAALFAVANVAMADQYVHGYTKKDGTFVEPHYRTEQNHTRSDNYSTIGNTNPYTGQPGYKPDDSYGSYNSSHHDRREVIQTPIRGSIYDTNQDD